jgi:hypothetical protein
MPMAMSCALVGAVVVASGTGTAEAGLVAHWNFNGINPATGTVVAASSGAGSLDFASFGDGATVFGGSDLNLQGSDPAGDSLGLIGSSNNGSFAEISLSTLGSADLSLSFAVRRSGTGFGANKVQALLGGAWSDVASFTASSTAWSVVTVNLAALDSLENGTASLRLVFDGATSGLGTVRFDNLAISGSAVPAPGALSLAGLAAALTGRRRRG